MHETVQRPELGEGGGMRGQRQALGGTQDNRSQSNLNWRLEQEGAGEPGELGAGSGERWPRSTE